MKLQSKQVFKLLDAPLSVAGFATTNGVTNEDVTVEIQAILTAEGLVEAVATITTHGVLNANNNRVELWDNVTKKKIEYQGAEVYGRLTGAVGAWDLAYFYLDTTTGAETAYTSQGEVVQFDFNYRFEFHELPVDALVRTKIMVHDDITNGRGYEVAEELTIAVQNTVPNVSFQPNDTTTAKLMVNGKEEDALGLTPPVTFSLANTTVVWNTANAQYNLDTTDRVVARYHTFG
jgi:hypothetical protein